VDRESVCGVNLTAISRSLALCAARDDGALARTFTLSSRKIVKGEGQIEDDEKCEREQMHFEKINRAIVRENVEQCFRLRFMKKKAVIEPGELVRRQRDNEVKFCPGEDTNDGKGAWSQTIRQHKENNADDDSAVRNEEAKESEIGKTIGQIRGQHGLDSAADSPKIRDLEPARPPRPHRDDDYNHRPIAKLEW